MRDMNKFENIDYFTEAFGIEKADATSATPMNRDVQLTPSSDNKEEEELPLDFFGGGMPGMPESEPEGEDTAVRDWLLRRYMTLHTNEVNEKLKNNEEIVVHDPFAEPEKDVSDPFYPGGLEGNPNTEPPENPEIIYDPAGEEREAQELQVPDMGDPSAEHAASYRCMVPNSDVPTGNHSDTGMPFTQEQCAEAGGEWREIPMDVNPGEGGEDPWGHPDSPEGSPIGGP